MNRHKGIDPIFKSAGTKPGIEIWTVENSEVVLQPKLSHGDFYTDRSYIILLSRRENHGKEWAIHFWLGKNTTKEDAGLAAYKSVELDEMLGGCTSQYREVQGNESRDFCRLFPNGLRYHNRRKGTNKEANGKRFFQVKGKRYVRVSQVELTYESMNKGDVFILDHGLKIFCWNGSESSKIERVKAAEFARRIRNEERGGRAEIILVDEGTNPQVEEDFFTSLGSSGEIKSASEGLDDDAFDNCRARKITLYRVTEENGEISMEECISDLLTKDVLKSEASFILDTGPAGVFIWVGKKCRMNEKKAAISNAMEFVKARDYPLRTQLARILQGAEPSAFKKYFASWDAGTADDVSFTNDTTDGSENFEMQALWRSFHSEIFPDDCSGDLELWLITDTYQQKLDPRKHGVFFEGDCYVILYTYFEENGKEKYIIYYWQGRRSSKEAKKASRALAVKLDRNFNEEATLIQVVQGTESRHFIQIFNWRVIVLQGSSRNGIEGRMLSSDPTNYSGSTRLFQIQGANMKNTVVQVGISASNLDSNDVFLIQKKSILFMWEGKESSEEKKDFAEDLVDRLQPTGDLVIIQEGFEMDEFWMLLGGKGLYQPTTKLKEEEAIEPARLFQCSNVSGRLQVTEIRDFDQLDLCVDDVMILDTFREIYLWIGKGANEKEKAGAFDTATDFIKSHENGRNRGKSNIIEIKQDFEPVNFTRHFLDWQPQRTTHDTTYEDTISEMVTENAKAQKTNLDSLKYKNTYSYKELKRKHKSKDFDICNKERYLADAEFYLVFGMSPVEFYKKPKWKQVSLKKQMGLY